MANNEYNKFDHLSLIQGVINRLASNSFMIKGWLIAILTGSLALSDKIADKVTCLSFLYFSLIVIFWVSDAYFLYLERKYRNLYNHVNTVTQNNYDLQPSKSELPIEFCNYLKAYFAMSKNIFYLPLILIFFFLIK